MADTEGGRLSRRLRDICGDMPTLPLVVLFLLFFFDEFDTAAVNVLAPNIRHEFDLTRAAFGVIVVVNLSIVLLLAIPVGHYGDRLPRRRLVLAGAVVAGVFSLGTGVAFTISALVAVRLGNGVGRLLNDSIHPSLLTDYYAPVDRPRVFAAHRNAVYFGSIVGSALAGVSATLFGWRWAFVILIAPIVITGLVGATKLHEPVRGGTDDAVGAAFAADEAPVPFKEARKLLFAVPTLRRQYVAWIFIGAALIPLAYLLPLMLEDVFHVDSLGRGLIAAVDAAATFGGIQLAGRWTTGWLGMGMGEPLKRAGLVICAVGVGVAGIAASPNVPVLVAVSIVTSFVVGIFYPPFYVTQAFVSPARVRTLSFSFGALFLVAGVWALYFIPGLATLADTQGERWGLVATVPYWIIGGLVLRSGHRFVADDTNRAFAMLSEAPAVTLEAGTAPEPATEP